MGIGHSWRLDMAGSRGRLVWRGRLDEGLRNRARDVRLGCVR
jgi:hypothetical protein